MNNHKFSTIFIKPTLSRCLVYMSLFTALILMPLKLFANNNDSGLSLQEAISQTLEKHPELSIFIYKKQAQQGQITQASLTKKPEVQLTLEDAFGSDERSGLKGAQTTLSVSWILENNIMQERVNVASKGFDLINSDKTIKRFDIATQTTRYFLNALYLQEAMNIAERSITLAEQTATEIEKRIKLGIAPSAELYRVQAELANRKMDLVDLKHEHLSALHQLSAQWGSQQPNFSRVSGDFSRITRLKTFDRIKNKILNNPQIIKYHAKEQVKLAELKLAQEQQSPRWQFSTGLRRYEQTNDYGVVASFSIPFGGSNNNQGNIARVNAEKLLNQAELEAFTIALESQVFVAFQNYEHSNHVMQLLSQEIIPKLEKALVETKKIYDAGKYSYLEWLNVQNELLNARSKLLNTQLSAHLNVLIIERLTGSIINQ